MKNQSVADIFDEQLRDGDVTVGWNDGLAPPARRAAAEPQDCLLACEDNLAFMGKLPAASIKLIVTSPPYNVGKSYERRASLDSYLQGQREVVAECVRLLHPAGSLCWQVGNYVDRGEIVPLDAVLYPVFR